jgi:hypothetical protein
MEDLLSKTRSRGCGMCALRALCMKELEITANNTKKLGRIEYHNSFWLSYQTIVLTVPYRRDLLLNAREPKRLAIPSRNPLK